MTKAQPRTNILPQFPTASPAKAPAELCELSPDVRFGQLLAHLGFLGEDQAGRTLWDIDDEQLLAVLHHHRGELVARTGDSAAVAGKPSGSVGR